MAAAMVRARALMAHLSERVEPLLAPPRGDRLAEDVRPESIPDDLAARIGDAFGLFGTAEACLERLERAREAAGVGHVFLFPAHTLEGGYDMPVREVEAFRRVIRPRLAGAR